MSFLNEYNPEFGVVFGWEEDLEAWKQANGVGGGGGTTTAPKPPAAPPTSFAQSSLQDKKDTYANQPGYFTAAQLAAMPGARQVGNNTIIVGSGDKYTLEAGTGYYKAFGTANTADKQAYLSRGTPIGGAAPGTSQTTTTSQTPTPSPLPFSGLAAIAPNAPGMRTSGLPSSVNSVAIQNPNQGFNGFINKGEGVRLPPTFGVGPGIGTNRIEFNPNERGFTEAKNPIMGSYTVPDWLNAETGRNDAGVGMPYTMGVTPGPRGDNSLESMVAQAAATFPVQVAGNNVQVFRPDGGSTGFALGGLPATNIAMAQGRNFEGLSPQQQAAATAMLLDQQMNGGLSGAWRGGMPAPAPAPAPSGPPTLSSISSGITPSTPGYSPNLGGSTTSVPNFGPGAYGPGNAPTGPYGPAFGNDQQAAQAYAQAQVAQATAAAAAAQTEKEKEAALAAIFAGDYSPDARGYAMGGRVATGPLGGVDQVTNEPIIGIGTITGKKHFLLGEDNADRDRAPNPEMITITPMKSYAEGGKVATGPMPDPGFTTGPVINPTKPVTPYVDPGATTGPVSVDPRTPTLDPGATTGPVGGINRPTGPFTDPGYTTNPVIDPGGQVVPFDPLSASLLKPWQEAAQANRLRDANIRRFGYRGDYGGLAAPIAIQVEEGDIPSGPLGAGMYYDTTNQINRGLSTLMGAQEAYRNLAPAIETTPLHAREGEIDTTLGLFERLRNSTLERSTLPPVIDTNPLYAREGEISTVLELFDRMRNLDIQRVAAVATDAAAKQGLIQERNALAAQREAAANLFNQLTAYGYNHPPLQGDLEGAKAYQQYLDAYARLTTIDTNLQQLEGRIASPSADVVAIDTTLADLAQKTQGLNEGTLQTERGVIRSALSQNQQRIEREIELNNLIGELTGKTQGLNEGALSAERNLIRSKLSTNTSRMEKEKELQNQVKALVAKGVPKINAPIVPVAA